MVQLFRPVSLRQERGFGQAIDRNSTARNDLSQQGMGYLQ